MDSPELLPSSSSRFRAKEAGVVLLVTLVSLLLADYLLARLLEYFRDGMNLFSLAGKTVNEMRALRSILSGFIDPAIIIGVSAGVLKACFPCNSFATLCQFIGMSGKPPLDIMGISFAVGVVVIFSFTGLSHVFPPGEFVTPHPANVINEASIVGKLIFALTACTLVPIAEEILFRGVLYKGIANSWGKPISAILVSFAFIAGHPGTIESGYWLTHATLYLAPIVMIALREIFGTLYAPMAAHAGFNFTEIFF